ncbi:MAG: LamG domain-containing protein [Candidatus Poribacteria bacterium]|nr:LamG domain-containing protein [Candidatus Poribacteria bacterium]
MKKFTNFLAQYVTVSGIARKRFLKTIFQQLVTCIILLTWILLSANAVPPSPAGGRMLRLDETHDFVGTSEAWFPDEQFEGLTAEAWIYFEEPPEFGTFWTIIGQEGRFGLVLYGGNKDTLGTWGYAEGADHGLSAGGDSLPTRKWVHVVALYDASAGDGVNGKGGNACCPGGHLIRSDKPLRIGGIVAQNVNKSHFKGENLKLRGYIDEVRISNIVRYKGPEWKVPKGKFRIDEHTISLWHFDEAPWSGRFKDETENGYDLWRSGAMPVEAQSKLTTTSGKLKK